MTEQEQCTATIRDGTLVCIRDVHPENPNGHVFVAAWTADKHDLADQRAAESQ